MMPNRTPTYKMMMLVLLAGAGFWLMPLIYTGLQLQEVFNSVVFGIATVVLVTWGPSVFFAMRGGINAENQHIVSTVAVWFIVWIQRLYAIIFVSLDRPTWLMISAFPAFLTYMFGVMGVLAVVAPAFVKDANMKDYYIQLIAGIILGVVLSGISYLVQVQ